ncbi:hypothetical protein Gpo141_00005700 [Globisporangium polare]
MATPADMHAAAFVADGQFAADGGATLQRLWDFCEWKMIRNCPGRYVLKQRKSAPVRVQLASSDSDSSNSSRLATDVDTRAFLTAALGEEHAAAIAVYQLQSERCADAVQVAIFHDSGGVITYCKRDASEDGAVVYVHTLNTSSGLQRKLQGLRLDHVLQL